MTSFLFVHGTGVREKSSQATLRQIESEVHSRQHDGTVKGCEWGVHYGTKRPDPPLSIPDYDTTKSAGGATSDDQAIVLWEMLYDDPLFELRLLAQAPGELKPLAPNEESDAQVLADAVDELKKAPEVLDTCQNIGLDPYWQEAYQAVCRGNVYDAAMQSPVRGTGAHRVALARGLVAAMIAAAIEEGLPVPAATERDLLVDLILDVLGGGDKAASDIVTKPLLGLVQRFGTWKVRRNRGKYSYESFEIVGDILLYQVRGEKIRECIRKDIEAIGRSVVVIAHSLGGIACVDLLADTKAPTVRALVTVGSQSPFFYEMDALWSRTRNKKLPETFPPWLNFYDLNDPLSYIGEKIFGKDRVRDVEIESGQPFPASHSAYWRNPDVWSRLLPFVDGLPP